MAIQRVPTRLYRKNALIDVGLFRQNRATEDISIAWDHQFQGWLSLFAPRIMFFHGSS